MCWPNENTAFWGRRTNKWTVYFKLTSLFTSGLISSWRNWGPAPITAQKSTNNLKDRLTTTSDHVFVLFPCTRTPVVLGAVVVLCCFGGVVMSCVKVCSTTTRESDFLSSQLTEVKISETPRADHPPSKMAALCVRSERSRTQACLSAGQSALSVVGSAALPAQCSFHL